MHRGGVLSAAVPKRGNVRVICQAPAAATGAVPAVSVNKVSYSGGYAAVEKNKPLQPWGHSLEPLGSNQVDIKVTHNGVCHTDIHMRDDDWFISKFPFIPGHEVVGEVLAVGSSVTNLRPGQRVGAGWISNSCRACSACIRGEENICAKGYEGLIVGGRHGGFQAVTRIQADFAFDIPDGLDSASAAPLLCAGITVYAPLRKYITHPGMKVAILGIGGLGHLALQFANAMGAVVTALDRNPPADKQDMSLKFGAHRYIQMLPDTPATLKGEFDIILNCASGAVAAGPLLGMLANDGSLIQVGIPGDRAQMVVPLTDVVFGQKKVVGSIVGGRSDMKSMLELAAAKGIKPMIEVMPSSKINEALDRVQQGKARYRIVLDMQAEADPNLIIKS